MSAFEEGQDAYRRGDGIGLNPYDDYDAQFDEWEDGWAYFQEDGLGEQQHQLKEDLDSHTNERMAGLVPN